jgi:hypothetical protein
MGPFDIGKFIEEMFQCYFRCPSGSVFTPVIHQMNER